MRIQTFNFILPVLFGPKHSAADYNLVQLFEVTRYQKTEQKDVVQWVLYLGSCSWEPTNVLGIKIRNKRSMLHKIFGQKLNWSKNNCLNKN